MNVPLLDWLDFSVAFNSINHGIPLGPEVKRGKDKGVALSSVVGRDVASASFVLHLVPSLSFVQSQPLGADTEQLSNSLSTDCLIISPEYFMKLWNLPFSSPSSVLFGPTMVKGAMLLQAAKALILQEHLKTRY